MSDFDRLLQQSLKQAAGSHEPASLNTARERFVRTRRRRSLFTAATSLAVLAALVTTVVAAPWDRGPTDIVGPAPGPTARPGEMIITAATEVDSAPSDMDFDGDRLFVGSAQTAKITVVNPETNNVEFVIDPFGKGRRVTGHGPTSTDVLDVSNGVLTTASGGWYSKANVGPHGEDPKWDTPHSAKWSGPIWDLVVTIDEDWIAAPAQVDEGGRVTRLADTSFGIFRVVPPIFQPIGEHFGIPEPARLDFGYGNLWAAQSIGHEWLTRIDPETLERTTVPEPGGSRHDIDSDLEVSVGAGAVWTHFPAQESLIRVDPATARISGKWPMAGREAVIEATEDLGVFVMIHRSQTVSRLYRIDPNSGDTLGETMDFAGPGPFALESGFGSLWVADQSHNKVYRIEVGEQASPQPEVVYPDEEREVSPEPELDEGNDKKSEREKAIEALVDKISNRLADQTAVKELIRLMKQDELSLEEEAHLQALMKNLLGKSRDRADLITKAIERALEEAQSKTEAP